MSTCSIPQVVKHNNFFDIKKKMSKYNNMKGLGFVHFPTGLGEIVIDEHPSLKDFITGLFGIKVKTSLNHSVKDYWDEHHFLNSGNKEIVELALRFYNKLTIEQAKDFVEKLDAGLLSMTFDLTDRTMTFYSLWCD